MVFFVETWLNFISEMDKFLNIVKENLSAGEIDGNKLKLFLGKVKTCKDFQNFKSRVPESLQG